MKICPNCRQTYIDDNLNFCLNDGSMLSPHDPGAEPRTIVMDQARRTQPNWAPEQTAQPLSSWSGPQNLQQPQMSNLVSMRPPSQSLATIALVLGIFALLLFCCHGGIPLGAGAIISGYIAMNQEKTDPTKYGGRGLAIAGIVTGGIGVMVGLVWVMLAILGSLA